MLFRETRQVDHAFLRKVRVPSFSLTVREEDLALVRKERIRLLLRSARDIFRAWPVDRQLEDAIRCAYTRGEFSTVLENILALYTRETRELSASIRLFGPLQPAATAFAAGLERVMNDVAAELVASYTNGLYGAGERP